MNSIIKNFYCDWVLLVDGHIAVIDRIIFIFSKYIYLLFSLFRVRMPLKLFNNKYLSNDNYGLLGFQIMLKDFQKYYFISLESPVIFDVGGHIGNFTLAANLIYKNSSIYIFEPVKETYSILSENLKNYHNVNIFNMAFGNYDGVKEMFFSRGELDRSSFFKSNIIDKSKVESAQVHVAKLSTFVIKNNINKIDLLKIDVEGFEEEVIEGAVDILDRVNNIVIEVHFKKTMQSVSNLFHILNSAGFYLARIGKVWQEGEYNGQLKCLDLIFKRQ